MFDESGAVRTDHVSQQQVIIDRYVAEVTARCPQYPSCRYDEGATSRAVIDLGDLSSDDSHLSVVGHAGFAEVAWDALSLT